MSILHVYGNEIRLFKDKNIAMTLYLVRAKPKNDLSELRKELDSGKISKLRPFGETLQFGLEWDYCKAYHSYANLLFKAFISC